MKKPEVNFVLKITMKDKGKIKNNIDKYIIEKSYEIRKNKEE